MSIYIVSILDGLMPEEIAKKMLHKHILLYRRNILNIEKKKKESATPRQNRNRMRIGCSIYNYMNDISTRQ